MWRTQTTNGLGIVGMRERIEALGGRLSAGFRSDNEFLLEAIVPLQPLADLIGAGE